MRIIAGEAKNRIIKTRKGFDTRPTLESVKESLFSIIAPYVEGSIFLDLFSGSGSISLEAISRGAKRAVMIEKDGEALKYIIENIDNLGFSDIIFMDPPYQDNVTKKVLKAIDKANILTEDGLIICEHHLLEDLEDNIASFRKTDERKYNKKILTFYTKWVIVFLERKEF